MSDDIRGLASQVVEDAAQAMADYIGEPARTPTGELTYRPYVEAVLAAVLPLLADEIGGFPDLDAAVAMLRDLAEQQAVPLIYCSEHSSWHCSHPR